MSSSNKLTLDFARKHPDDFARVLGRGEPREMADVLANLPAATAASIASRLSASRVRAILAAEPRFEDDWLREASLDDAKTLLSRMPRGHCLTVVNAIADRSRRRKLLQYLNYPAHSVGALVTDVPLRFSSASTAADVIAELREQDAKNPPLVAIVSPDGRYLGTLNAWGLLMQQKAGRELREFMTATPSLHPETSLHSAAAEPGWQRYDWLPVVDHEQKLLGGITRSSLYSAIENPQAGNVTAAHLFEVLFSDLVRLLGNALERTLSRKGAS
jgi:Mg/Co/Ni transporter MgtE